MATNIRFDPGEPNRGPELQAALGRLVTSATGYLDSLPDPVFFAKQGDRWSPAEHIRHLRKSTAPVAKAMRLPRLVLRFWFGRHRTPSLAFVPLREVYRGVLAEGGLAGRFAPGPDASPQDTARRRQIMRAWRDSAAALDAAMGRWSERAMDRCQLPHPLLGLLSVREMLEFTVYHTSHHLNLIASRLESSPLPIIRPALRSDLDPALGLLAELRLPVAGVAEGGDRFLVAESAGRLIGLAGVEHYGTGALLRSVAVSPEAQGSGTGQRLVEAVIALARTSRSRDVYLLTTTAERWFPRFGFVPIERAEVPESVQASLEFRGACPSTATAMHLHLQ